MKKILQILFIGLSASVLLLGVTVAFAVNTPGSSASADTVKLTAAQQAAMSRDLTVSTSSYTCTTDGNGLTAYRIGALQPVPPRKWSDALSVPLANADPNAARAELQGNICADPLLGVTWAHFLAHTTIGGVNLASVNSSWLSPYTSDASEITKEAAAFVPLLDVDHPTTSQLEDAAGANQRYQKLASYTNSLLGRFSAVSITAKESTLNYHLQNGGLSVGGLPPVEINGVQENLPALVLDVTMKGVCAAVGEIGANTGDQRPELFATPTCAPPPAPAPAPAPAQPAPQKGVLVPPSTPHTSPSHPSVPPQGCNSCGGHTTPPTCSQLGTCSKPPTTCQWALTNGKCLAPKNSSENVAPPQGTTRQGSDGVQNGTTKGTGSSESIGTSGSAGHTGSTGVGTGDHGSSVPVQGASPAPAPASPAPVVSQAPAPTDPGTHISDPG